MPPVDLAPIPRVRLRDDSTVPALGVGTWHMGESPAAALQEAEVLRLGLDLGMSLMDTAEMYGEGAAEEVVAAAVGTRRAETFIVSKVYPQNAGARSAAAACEASLRRLGTDYLDLYLLHWRGRIPLAETVRAFTGLLRDGRIRRWGVSNFDVGDMEDLFAVRDGDACTVNQVLYNLSERGAEWRLLEWCRGRRIPLMAYSPMGQGSLLRNRKLAAVAQSLGCTPAQVALAWTMRHPDVIAIPKSAEPHHLRENRAAVGVTLDAKTIAALDAAFPPPRQPTTLSVS